MRRFSLVLAVALTVTASGLRESSLAAFGSAFVTAQATSVPPASPAPSPSPLRTVAPRRRGVFGRRPLATPRPTPAPTATLAPPTAAPAPSASPTPVPTPVPSPSPKPTSADRAFSLAGGTWDCESMAEGTGTHVYEQSDEDTLAMVNRISFGGRTYTIEETYRFDPAAERWTTTTGRDAYVGTAGPWTGERWVFDGLETVRGVRHRVRMIYIDLGGNAFRRDFQSLENRRWTTFSAETCKRAAR